MQDVNHQLFTDSIASEVSLGIKNIESSYVENILKKLDLYEIKRSSSNELVRWTKAKGSNCVCTM